MRSCLHTFQNTRDGLFDVVVRSTILSTGELRVSVIPRVTELGRKHFTEKVARMVGSDVASLSDIARRCPVLASSDEDKEDTAFVL
jgi:hypothetical protein